MTKPLALPDSKRARPLYALIYEGRKKSVQGVVFLETVCCMHVCASTGCRGRSVAIDWLTQLYALDGYTNMRRVFAHILESRFKSYIVPRSRTYHRVIERAFNTLDRWMLRPRPHRVRLHYPYADYRYFWDTGDYPEYMRTLFLAIDAGSLPPGEGVILPGK